MKLESMAETYQTSLTQQQNTLKILIHGQKKEDNKQHHMLLIFYFSVFMFLFIIIIISNMMFAPLSQLAAGTISFIKPIISQAASRRLFLHAALLESLFGGLIAGKINEDSFADGLKHVAVLPSLQD